MRGVICVVCETAFEGKRADALTCSATCRKRLSRRPADAIGQLRAQIADLAAAQRIATTTDDGYELCALDAPSAETERRARRLGALRKRLAVAESVAGVTPRLGACAPASAEPKAAEMPDGSRQFGPPPDVDPELFSAEVARLRSTGMPAYNASKLVRELHGAA